MSDEKTYTEREVVARERVAAAKMRCAALHEADDSDTGKGRDWQDNTGACPQCRARAAECFPRPKVTLPREMTTTGKLLVRVVNTVAQYFACGQWNTLDGIHTGPNHWCADDLRKLADLYDSPTEEVEA